jgi:hypothetical protein
MVDHGGWLMSMMAMKPLRKEGRRGGGGRRRRAAAGVKFGCMVGRARELKAGWLEPGTILAGWLHAISCWKAWNDVRYGV